MHLDIERQHMESTNIYRTKDAYGKKQSIWKVESHLERLPKGQKALEWLKGLKLGWVVEVRDDQGGWVLRKP